MSNIIDSIRLSGTTYQIQGEITVDAALDSGSTNPVANSAITTAIDDKQDTLVSSQNIKTINNESILGSGNIDIQGGGKAVSGGTNISITTGETADTINCTLPMSTDSVKKIVVNSNYSSFVTSDAVFTADSLSNSILLGNNTFNIKGIIKGDINNNLIIGSYNTSNLRNGTKPTLEGNLVVGSNNVINSSYSLLVGNNNTISRSCQFAVGYKQHPNNDYETSLGNYNVSSIGSSTFGDSGNTLFSVGNGTSENARHNAFEIRQNGDIYITSGNTDIKLQDHIGGGGGGSSYTAGDGIDITSDVISVTGKVDTSTYNTYTAATDTALTSKADTATTYTKTEVDTALGGKADTSAVTAIQDSLSGYVTTDTEQIISGRKIFTYTSSSNKAIEFKQTDDSSKVGFRVRTSAATNNELASFEFRPNTFTIDNVQHPLIYFGHYRTTNTANAGVPQTVIGFRQYDQKNAAAYHYLMPLPEKAKTSFNLTTTFKDYYAPMGFKNGSMMIIADNTGVVDLSSEFSGKVNTSTYNTYTAATDTALNGKQATLISGTNIKTINNQSLLGSGNIDIQGGGGGGTVESAITSGSTNAVESKAIWSATTFNKNVLLTFDGLRQSTNYPEGCTKLNVEVAGYGNASDIDFFNDDQPLGNIIINNWGSITVDTNQFGGASYEISGTTVIITYPTVTVTKIWVGVDTSYTYTAVVEGAWVNENTYMKPEVDAIASGLQNNINSKLDATAYTPTVVDSALYAGSTNPVQNQALYPELRIDNGEAETTLTFENDESTNYPNGCTKLIVEVVGSNNMSDIEFYNNDQRLGNIIINNWGSITVDTNQFGGASYEISGTTVIITYPTVTSVTKIWVNNDGNYVFKAITSLTTPLKDKVVANTTALGGLSLVKLTQAEYDALATKDSNTLYVIVN